MKYAGLHKRRVRTTPLEDLRRRRGWSQSELSRRSGISKAAISYMERPKETGYVAGVRAINALAATLEVDRATIAKGQLGKFECSCCGGRGYTIYTI